MQALIMIRPLPAGTSLRQIQKGERAASLASILRQLQSSELKLDAEQVVAGEACALFQRTAF